MEQIKNPYSREAPRIFSVGEVLEALAVCPFTAYRIAAETGLTTTSVSNYMSGKNRPAVMARKILAAYLGLDEYEEYKRNEIAQGRTPREYKEFIEERGYMPLKGQQQPQFSDPLYTRSVGPEPNLFSEPLGVEDPRFAMLERMQKELKVAYDTIQEQRVTIEEYRRQIAQLWGMLQQTKEK